MENTNDFLGIDPKSDNVKTPGNSGSSNSSIATISAETVVTILAYVILIGGILFSLIYGLELTDSRYTRSLGVAVILGGTIYSVIGWAFLMLFAKLSVNIREIKELLKKKL